MLTVSSKVSELEAELGLLKERELNFLFEKDGQYATRDLSWVDSPEGENVARLRTEKVAKKHVEEYVRKGHWTADFANLVNIVVVEQKL